MPLKPLPLMDHSESIGPGALVRPGALTIRLAPVCMAVAGLALAVAVAAGLLSVPDLDDATDSLGGGMYGAVGLLVLLECTMIVGFVIQGELALMVGGVAAERGNVLLAAIVPIAWFAAVTGDSASLLLGRRLGRPFLERHGPRLRFGPRELARVERFFKRHGRKAIFFGRFVGFFRATMPFAAGSSGVAIRRVLPFMVASGLVWTLGFTLIGYA